MIEFLLLANLHNSPNMTCEQIREVAETVLESDMSQQSKQRFLSRLFGKNMTLKCLKK